MCTNSILTWDKPTSHNKSFSDIHLKSSSCSELNIEDPEHDTSYKIAKSQLLRQFRQRSENPSPAERAREDPIENSHMSKVQV